MFERMTEPQLRNEERELMAHRYLYYVESMPILTDYDYDIKERAFRQKIGEDSPSPINGVGSSLYSSYTQDEINLAKAFLLHYNTNGRQQLPESTDNYWMWNNLLGDTSSDIFDTLLKDVYWQQPDVELYGLKYKIPRMQCWMGNEDVNYQYSDSQLKPVPWHESVTLVKNKIESVTGMFFNSVLLNLYRDGNDSVGWHADDEKELGDYPFIASYSLGKERRFVFRKKKDKSMKHSIILPHDSLLLMSPEIQHNWHHALPKMRGVRESRINMTFRNIVTG